jgi:prevent-host-death family protein
MSAEAVASGLTFHSNPATADLAQINDADIHTSDVTTGLAVALEMRCGHDRERRLIYDQFSGHMEQVMVTVTLVQAKARLSELLDKVEAGEEVVVTRHGRAVARILSAVRPKQPLPLDDLAAFRATMPRLRRPSAKLLREARDEGR